MWNPSYKVCQDDSRIEKTVHPSNVKLFTSIIIIQTRGTRSAMVGNSACEIPREAQSAGVPAKILQLKNQICTQKLSESKYQVFKQWWN